MEDSDVPSVSEIINFQPGSGGLGKKKRSVCILKMGACLPNPCNIGGLT